jgi:hypothetical protein
VHNVAVFIATFSAHLIATRGLAHPAVIALLLLLLMKIQPIILIKP